MVNIHYHEPSKGYIAEHELFEALLESKECEEGVDAFIEKRKPNF
jgi:enoyl-CoA hydratase/carnithine racemase